MTLRFASPDVIHGLLVTGTNVNTMVVPGYVSQVHTEFTATGDLLMPCHEYCGLGHSEMWATVQVIPQNEMKPDAGREGVLCATLSGSASPISGSRSRPSSPPACSAHGRCGCEARWARQVGTPGHYFMSVTAHGVAMAYVLTTFFIMGFGYFVAVTALERPLPGKAWAWGAFWVAIVGVVLTVVPIALGQGLGALHLLSAAHRERLLLYRPRPRRRRVVGVVLLMLVAMRDWKRENPGAPVPLAMFATVANAVMWLWTTVGVAVAAAVSGHPGRARLDRTIDVGLSRTLFSWTLHAIVYFWLIPAYIAFYTMVPRAAGGRLYSDTMGRLTFILFLVYSLPVGMHHLMMDPEHGNATKFIQVLLTAFVSVPTLLTIFTITASLEIAGRLRGGRGVFGWIGALPWDRPMVLAAGLAFVMLGFGGFGGLINMGYGMNAMVHNTSWVTAHFHLIFGGSVVIMYFAIAYEIWPRLTGREHASLAPLRLQLWLWFVGMMVMTLPWHWLGLQGQWRRVANFNYADPIIAAWGPWVIVSFGGGLVLLASALLFVRNLYVLHRSPLPPRCRGRCTRWPCTRRTACRRRSTASGSGMCWCSC